MKIFVKKILKILIEYHIGYTHDSVLTILRIFGLLVISIAFVRASMMCGTSKIRSPCIHTHTNRTYL